jgi:hypothetical protein
MYVGEIKTPTPNMTKRESTALKSLRNNKQIRILQVGKGNCMVALNESTYKEKISSLLESGVYEILPKDPTSQIERKIRQLLTKHKTVLPIAVKCKPPTTANPLTSMVSPRYTNLTSHSDQ